MAKAPHTITVTADHPGLRKALREAAAEGWDAAVASMQYEDGTPVEIVRTTNPFREKEEE